MLFDFELLRTVFGLLTIVVGTASGIAALLVDYRDKQTGQITKWGRYAILGIGASFVIGAINLWVDYTQKQLQTREAANRAREASEASLRILTDVTRTLNPLKDVRATYWATYPFDQTELARYRQRLEDGLRALLPSLSEGKFVQGAHRSWPPGDGTVVEEVTLEQNSPLFPDPNKETFAYTILARTEMRIKVYKTPMDPAVLAKTRTAPQPDLQMYFLGYNKLREEYNLQKRRISVYGFNIESDPRYWDSSGNIVSVLDLVGAQLVITIHHSTVSFKEPNKRVEAELTDLALKIADRSDWWLRKDKLKLYRDDTASPFYVYVFPNTYESLLLETKRK